MGMKTVGHAGLVGWREKVGDKAATFLSRKTPLRRQTARAILGLGFLALSLRTAARMLTRLVRETRTNTRS
jgi:hypothetical protein